MAKIIYYEIIKETKVTCNVQQAIIKAEVFSATCNMTKNALFCKAVKLTVI